MCFSSLTAMTSMALQLKQFHCIKHHFPEGPEAKSWSWPSQMMFWNKPSSRYLEGNDNVILYWSLCGKLSFYFWFQIVMWRIKTENRCCCLSHQITSAQVCVAEIKYSLIKLLRRKKITRRHTYRQPSGVKFTLCLVWVYSGGDNDSAHAAAFLSSGFRLAAGRPPAAPPAREGSSFQNLNLIRGCLDSLTSFLPSQRTLLSFWYWYWLFYEISQVPLDFKIREMTELYIQRWKG